MKEELTSELRDYLNNTDLFPNLHPYNENGSLFLRKMVLRFNNSDDADLTADHTPLLKDICDQLSSYPKNLWIGEVKTLPFAEDTDLSLVIQIYTEDRI